MLFTIQLIIILICLFYGARKGGIALGLLGGIGLVILVFVFHLQPGKPPVDVMLVIIAVVAASATLQASGGLDVMLQIAEKLLRRNPKYVSIVAPFVTCTTNRLKTRCDCSAATIAWSPVKPIRSRLRIESSWSVPNCEDSGVRMNSTIMSLSAITKSRRFAIVTPPMAWASP